MIEQMEILTLRCTCTLYTHVMKKLCGLFQAEANIRFQHSIFLWGASHLQCNSGNPCRDYLFCAMKPWLVGGLRGNVGPCCFKTSWWFATSGFGRKKGSVQRWWQKLNTCQVWCLCTPPSARCLGLHWCFGARGVWASQSWFLCGFLAF